MGLSFAEVPLTQPDVFGSVKGLFIEAKEATGLQYLCHGPREGDPNNKETLERSYFPKLLRVLEIMPDLGMDLLTVHLWVDTRFVREDVMAFKIRLLSRLTEQTKAAGITVCIENLSERVEDLSPVLTAVPDLALTLDVGHGQLLTEKNTSIPIVEAFPDRISHVHVHDNLGGRTPGDDLHLPVGEGRIDFGPIFESLCTMGYRGTMTLELRPDEIRGCLGRLTELLSRAGFAYPPRHLP